MTLIIDRRDFERDRNEPASDSSRPAVGTNVPPPSDTTQTAPPLFRFQSRRSVVHSTQGIVACTSPQAGQAGLKILEAGGNAADASVAASAVLAVVEPAMTGVGGDLFALYFDAAAGTVRGLNASGRSPFALTREIVAASEGVPVDAQTGCILDELKAAETAISTTSVHTVTVPAGAGGWVDLVEQFGSGKVTLAEILAPAICLAETGFPVSQMAAYYWEVHEAKLRQHGAAAELLKADPAAPDGRRPPREGELMQLPGLALLLRRLGAEGKAGFYDGPIAEAIVREAAAAGSLLRMEDLQYHARQPPDIHDALSLSVDGLGIVASLLPQELPSKIPVVRLWEHPPNGQGIVALLAIGILQAMERSGTVRPLSTLEHNSAEYLHAVISALRIAFADASWFVADPESDPEGGPKVVERLLSQSYLASRAALFDPEHALHKTPAHGEPLDGSTVEVDDVLTLADVTPDTEASLQLSDTVYLAVTDATGNGCSCVQSVAQAFGSGIVPKGTGFVLPNRGHMFRLGPPDHPNVLAGGKRAYNTIIPAILTAETDGARPSLHTVLGVMGGFMQPQGHVQVLLNLRAFGMDSQTALDAPRVCVSTAGFWTPEHRAIAAAEAAAAAEMVGRVGGGDSGDRGLTGKTDEGTVYVEEGVSIEAVAGLRALGYRVVRVTGYARLLFGRGQVIVAGHDAVMGQRVYAAGSDGRGDGHAVPL